MDVGWFVLTVCTAGGPLNRSRISRRRCRKPSRGLGERFNRVSPTQFDFDNSNAAVGPPVGEFGSELASE